MPTKKALNIFLKNWACQQGTKVPERHKSGRWHICKTSSMPQRHWPYLWDFSLEQTHKVICTSLSISSRHWACPWDVQHACEVASIPMRNRSSLWGISNTPLAFLWHGWLSGLWNPLSGHTVAASAVSRSPEVIHSEFLQREDQSAHCQHTHTHSHPHKWMCCLFLLSSSCYTLLPFHLQGEHYIVNFHVFYFYFYFFFFFLLILYSYCFFN